MNLDSVIARMSRKSLLEMSFLESKKNSLNLFSNLFNILIISMISLKNACYSEATDIKIACVCRSVSVGINIVPDCSWKTASHQRLIYSGVERKATQYNGEVGSWT